MMSNNYRDNDVEAWKEFKRMFGALAFIAVFLLIAHLLCGCDTTARLLQPPAPYTPSENFGDGGATRCGTTHCHKQLPPCQ